ncbi:hypothetical protein DXG01_011326, partial [Tephrocybe rancida]
VPWDAGHGSAGDEELAYGTRVPQVGTFSEESQLHGKFILMLKEKWKCEKHLGEHGEPGFCYTSTKGHFALNHLRFKSWAAAWAAGTCTKMEPPHTLEFDGAHDELVSTRPRGRTGPYPATVAASPSTVGHDMSTLLSVATATLLNDLTCRSSGSRGKRHRHYSSSPPSSPPRASSPSPHADTSIPAAGSELTACLNDFKNLKDVDLTMHEALLNDLELTPAIIPEVPVARLCEVLNVPEGRVHKLHLFCREWQTRLEGKRKNHKKRRV